MVEYWDLWVNHAAINKIRFDKDQSKVKETQNGISLFGTTPYSPTGLIQSEGWGES